MAVKPRIANLSTTFFLGKTDQCAACKKPTRNPARNC